MRVLGHVYDQYGGLIIGLAVRELGDQAVEGLVGCWFNSNAVIEREV